VLVPQPLESNGDLLLLERRQLLLEPLLLVLLLELAAHFVLDLPELLDGRQGSPRRELGRTSAAGSAEPD
jgi:hypothetical protein